ncbi:TonB-dependent receptor [Novosphingobium sp. CECT 9465]|uniref:TonB-dependent receptor n=1 Tax=Novosphingobium sp. CECT 9465 TaxID=2829794 RepID=UPI001E55F428|nr:TonB-dependent receptor [Novosphingobium sp. CECT 9465]CAH0498091.1 Vitamin B12 transporter BtuB [Novosphingobium sp. CECT 9465]
MRNSAYNRILLATVAPVVAFAMTSAAHAQTAQDGAQQAEESTGGLADIVVTARRTSENIQTVPVAVTALNAETLQERQVLQVTDLARTAPSLSIGTGGTGPATIVYLAIRGQAQNSPNSYSDAAVGIYIDGVYVARPIVGNLGFLDASGAEVLRGPQGTLFGRNTTGGALNLTTMQPQLDITEGYLKVGFGNYSQKVTEGVLNLPLTDELGVRVAGRYNDRDGYYPNLSTGEANGGIKGEYYARGSLKWAPSSVPLTLNLSGDYMNYRDTGNPVAVAAINPAGPNASFYGISQGVRSGAIPGSTPIPLSATVSVPASTFARFSQGPIGPITQYLNPEFATDAQRATLLSRDWRVNYGAPFTGDPAIDDSGTFNEAYSLTGNLSVDVGDVTIKSITGYRNSNTTSNLDLLGTNTGAGAFISTYKQHQFSEELQVSGNVGKLQYIFGGIYFREAGTEQSRSQIFYASPAASGGDNTFGSFVSTSKGLFAQLYYNVSDAVRLTGGLRYTWDTREIDRQGTAPNVPRPGQAITCQAGVNQGKPAPTGLQAPNSGCHDVGTAKFSYPAWTAGVDVKLTPDVFLYLKTSGASNSGGFNARPVPPPNSSSFKPEDVRDVEGGIKGQFFNNRVRTNLAVFHAWQSNVQRIINTTFVDGAGATRLTQFVTNAGKAKTYGFEFEGTVVPVDGLEIGGSVAYLNASYVKGSRIESQLVGGKIVQVDRSGEPITQAPKWTANASITQTFEMETGKLVLHGDYSYIGSRYFDFFTTGDPAQEAAVAIANEASRVRAYGLINLQASYTFNDPAIEVALWGRNVGNKANFTNVFNSYTGLGATVQFQGAPRTYGATVKYSF